MEKKITRKQRILKHVGKMSMALLNYSYGFSSVGC